MRSESSIGQLFFRAFRYLFLWVFYGVILAFFGVFFGFLSIYYWGTPSATELTQLPLAQTSVIYDRTGTHVLYTLHGEENRKVLSHDQIPDAVRAATVAAEDRNFFSHPGVDIGGTLRALWVDIQAGKIEQGGSTITQQLARNAFFSRERTFRRKILETVMAIKIERTFTKDEILDMYLNRVPYGANAYGIGVASETYFGKPAKDLSVDQAALLAALTKAPSVYSPYVASHTALKSQKDQVAKQMVQQGFLTDEQARTVIAADTAATIVPFSQSIQAPHFVFYVLDQLEQQYGREAIETGGWKIVTTLDWNLEQQAEGIVKSGVAKDAAYGASNGALVAIDPKTGEILAMVGSRDFFDMSIDAQVNVAVRPRQPGSSFKPIVYAAAFEKGFQPETLLADKPIDFGPDGSGNDYIPNNYDGQFHGTLPMRSTLAMSLNIPAVQTLYLAGINSTLDLASRLGITTLDKNPGRYGLALALGGGEVRLLDMTSAFGVFAREGVRVPAHGVLSITDQNGQPIEASAEVKATRVLDAEVARKVNSVLSDNQARTPTFGSHSPLILSDRPVAAKTGTTQDFHDAWTVGYTPSLAVGVWVGNNDNKPMNIGSDGVYAAAPLWHDFMVTATRSMPVENFTPYTPVVSDKPLLTGTPDSQGIRYFDTKSGKELSAEKAAKKDPDRVRTKDESHSILYYVNKSDPLGDTPPDMNDPMLPRWEGWTSVPATPTSDVTAPPAP